MFNSSVENYLSSDITITKILKKNIHIHYLNFDNGYTLYQLSHQPGFTAHSCRAFCKRLTCIGFEAIPTKSIISRNSASPASHNCCTSSPPAICIVPQCYNRIQLDTLFMPICAYNAVHISLFVSVFYFINHPNY